ncbi:hypothetical protein HZU73_08573 [Apis mellifera caucasica]|nr:hypothetical protein HZU73_08573 [Apis mellifera caucasica]
MLVAVSKRGNDELEEREGEGEEEEQEEEGSEDVGNEAGKWETLEVRVKRGETKKKRRRRRRRKVAEARGDVWSGGGRGGMEMSRGNLESPRRVEKTRTRM